MMSRCSAPTTGFEDFGDEAVTMPLAVPPVEVIRAGHEPRAAQIAQSGARVVAAAFRGADALGSAVSAGSRGVSSQVRSEVAARWPSRPPGAQLPAAPPVGGAGPRVPWLAVTALLACAAGIVGLLLPLVELGGLASLALIDIPYLGVPLLGLFLLLSTLPLLDVWQRRVRWTAWLLVPALLGALPVALVVFAMPWLPRALHLLWATAPEKMLGAGAASVTLGGVDAALIVLAASALLLRLRNRLLRRRQPTGSRR